MFELLTSLSILMCFMIPSYVNDEMSLLVKKSKKDLKTRSVRRELNLQIIKDNDLNAIKQMIDDEFYFKVYLMMNEAMNTYMVYTYDFLDQGKVFKWENDEEEKEYEFNLLTGLKYKKMYQTNTISREFGFRYYCSERELEFWEDLFEVYRGKRDEKYRALRENRDAWVVGK